MLTPFEIGHMALSHTMCQRTSGNFGAFKSQHRVFQANVLLHSTGKVLIGGHHSVTGNLQSCVTGVLTAALQVEVPCYDSPHISRIQTPCSEHLPCLPFSVTTPQKVHAVSCFRQEIKSCPSRVRALSASAVSQTCAPRHTQRTHQGGPSATTHTKPGAGRARAGADLVELGVPQQAAGRVTARGAPFLEHCARELPHG
jgi:hypothetical protein